MAQPCCGEVERGLTVRERARDTRALSAPRIFEQLADKAPRHRLSWMACTEPQRGLDIPFDVLFEGVLKERSTIPNAQDRNVEVDSTPTGPQR